MSEPSGTERGAGAGRIGRAARVGLRALRSGGRLVAPIVAWGALVVVLAHAPGQAAGTEPGVPAEGRPGDTNATGAGGGLGAGAGTRSGTAQATGAAAAGVAPVDAGKARPPILYVPPSRGAARHTAGAGTRSPSPSAQAAGPRPKVGVLAPRDHVGLTAHPSPTLFWLLSAPTSSPIELTVVDDEAIEPLLQLRLPGPVEAGLHALDLSALGVVLPPDKTVRWFVALIHDPLRRSRDALAEGAIERIAPEAPARALAADGTAAERSAALRDAARHDAEQGRWYDALAALSRAIELAPGDRALVADREALLAQAKLGIAVP